MIHTPDGIPPETILVKKAGECICDTLRTSVAAGVNNVMFETTMRIKVEETIAITIPLNVDCVCEDTRFKGAKKI